MTSDNDPAPETPPPAPDSVPPPAPSTLAAVKDAAQSVAELATEATALGLAWLELAKAEAVVARNHALRIVAATMLMAVLGLAAWLFACAAIGYGLAALIGRIDVAMAIVAALNLILIVVLVMAIKRWWRAMQMPHSRAALTDMAKSLAPGDS